MLRCLCQNSGEILTVNVVKIIIDNIFNSLSKSFKNVQILGQGEALDFQGVGQKFKLTFEFFGRNAVQFQRSVKKAQQTVYLMKGGFGYQTEVDILNQVFKKHIDQRLDTKGKPQAVKLHFMITAVHRRNIDGNMSFFVNILPNFKCFI